MKKPVSHKVKTAVSRKRADDALPGIENLYQTLAESSPDMIYLVDADGVIQYINLRAAQAFGQTPADLIGKRTAMAFPQEIARHYMEEIDLVVTTKKQRVVEILEQFPTGARWISTRLVPITGPGREVIQILGISTDVTERTQAEMAHGESENKFRLITETIDEVFWMGDVEMGKIFYISPSFERIWGRSRESLYENPRSFLDAVHGEDRERVLATLEIEKTGQPFDHEYRIILPDGNIRYIWDRGFPLPDENGQITRYAGIAMDITGRKRAEEALRQTNKKLNLLCSITRHDILNQLLGIRGYIRLSREVIDNPEKILEFIKKEEQAANTIEQQIMFTKDYHNLGVAAPIWQNVNECIRSAMATLPLRAVNVELDPADPEVYADPLFEKVFFNLIDNALRYGGDQMKTIRVLSQEYDQGLTVVCENDGVGIKDEDKKRIFTRGFGKNTGFGLFLSREILSITGITITENGVPGKGTRFEITVANGTWRTAGNVT
jgi:PAS domain S-box-containing protein